MTPARVRRIREVLRRRQPDLTVLLDNVHKPHNFSAILRSCDAVGVMRVHGVWPEARLRPTNHTSGGSRKWVKVETHKTLKGAIAHLKARGFRLYAAHLAPGARDFRECDYTAPTAIALGAELTGLGEPALEEADLHLTIPMSGMVHSLNVSVAAAVLLFEAQRQRLEAGLYARSRLSEEEHERTLLEWLHPRVARYCREQGLEYPRVDERGEVVGFDRRRAEDLSGQAPPA